MDVCKAGLYAITMSKTNRFYCDSAGVYMSNVSIIFDNELKQLVRSISDLRNKARIECLYMELERRIADM